MSDSKLKEEKKWRIVTCGIFCASSKKKANSNAIYRRSGSGAGNHGDLGPRRKAGGPALLFERPKGSRIAAVTNLVGTERRMNLALEVDSLEEIAGRDFLDFWTCNRRRAFWTR